MNDPLKSLQWYAAIGLDGGEPIVAGLGLSREEAIRAAGENDYPEEDLISRSDKPLVVKVSWDQAEEIEAGSRNCSDLRIKVRR